MARVLRSVWLLASALALNGCAAQLPAVMPIPQIPVISPVGLGSGWTLNALGSREEPWCLATTGAPANGVVILQHAPLARQGSGQPPFSAALAVGSMGGAVPRGDFLWLLLDSDPRPFALSRASNAYTALPSTQGAQYALHVQASDARRLDVALRRAGSARIVARRVGETVPATIQSYALPRIPQVVGALEACSRDPTNLRAIQAAAGVARLQARTATTPPAGTAAERPRPSGADDAPVPVWAVPPSAPPVQPASAAPATPRAAEAAPAWQAPPAAPNADPVWIAPPSAAVPPAAAPN